MPYVKKVYGLPDLCFASPIPVGSSIEVFDRIYPAWIGGDIGCGIALYEIKEDKIKVKDDIKSGEMAKRLLDKFESTVSRSYRNNEVVMSDEAGPFSDEIGSIGGGNHFAELMRITGDSQLNSDKLYLCVHSGSRKYGQWVQENKVCNESERIKPSNDKGNFTKEFLTFMQGHDNCVEWAKCNRQCIAERFCKAANLTLGKKLYELTHNFIERNGDTYIHRKGSIPSKNGPALIPGSRGTSSYLVEQSAEHPLHSLPHGAGRVLTRTKAKDMFADKSIEDMSTTEMGSFVVSKSAGLLRGEHPDCYKNIDDIMQHLSNDYGVKILAKFLPVITVKM